MDIDTQPFDVDPMDSDRWPGILKIAAKTKFNEFVFEFPADIHDRSQYRLQEKKTHLRAGLEEFGQFLENQQQYEGEELLLVISLLDLKKCSTALDYNGIGPTKGQNGQICQLLLF